MLEKQRIKHKQECQIEGKKEKQQVRNVRCAAVQMCCSRNVAENIEKAEVLVRQSPLQTVFPIRNLETYPAESFSWISKSSNFSAFLHSAGALFGCKHHRLCGIPIIIYAILSWLPW